jgi:hypothetical protein
MVPANLTGYETSNHCYVSLTARYILKTVQILGQVYYTWDDVKNPSRNLAVYQLWVINFDCQTVFNNWSLNHRSVLNLNMLQWLSRAQVNYPSIFDDMKKGNGSFGVSLVLIWTDTNLSFVWLQIRRFSRIPWHEWLVAWCTTRRLWVFVEKQRLWTRLRCLLQRCKVGFRV